MYHIAGKDTLFWLKPKLPVVCASDPVHHLWLMGRDYLIPCWCMMCNDQISKCLQCDKQYKSVRTAEESLLICRKLQSVAYFFLPSYWQCLRCKQCPMPSTPSWIRSWPSDSESHSYWFSIGLRQDKKSKFIAYNSVILKVVSWHILCS